MADKRKKQDELELPLEMDETAVADEDDGEVDTPVEELDLAHYPETATEEVVEDDTPFSLNEPTAAPDEDFVPPQYDYNPPPPPMGDAPAGESSLVNFDFLEDETDLIKAGVYPARLAECRNQVSRISGNPLLVMDFVLLAHPDVPEPYRGKEYPLFLALIPSMGWKFKKVGTGLGVTIKKGAAVDFTALINTMVLIEIEVSEYNNEMRASVKDVFPMPDHAGEKWTPGMTFGNVPMF